MHTPTHVNTRHHMHVSTVDRAAHVQSCTHMLGPTYMLEWQEVAPVPAPAGHRAAGEPGEHVGYKLPCQAQAAQWPAPQLWYKPLPLGKPRALGCCVCLTCQELGIERSLFCLCVSLQPISTPGRTRKIEVAVPLSMAGQPGRRGGGLDLSQVEVAPAGATSGACLSPRPRPQAWPAPA